MPSRALDPMIDFPVSQIFAPPVFAIAMDMVSGRPFSIVSKS
jgi:hypothetical protein